MDLANAFSVTTLLVLVSISGVRSAAVTLSKSAEKGQLGNNSLSLFCDYTLQASESVLTITMKRKRAADLIFDQVAAYYESNINASYYPSGLDLQNRTVLTNPTPAIRRAVLQFYSILCADEADYQCEVLYAVPGLGNSQTNSSIRLVVTATPIFASLSLPYAPSIDLAENQNVTFTCTGNVGREPQGTFSWYKYVGGQLTGGVLITIGVKLVSLTIVNGSCTYVRTETLTLNLTKEDNKMVIRCTVKQSTMTAAETGDGYMQTDPISVYYAPRISSIRSNPNLISYTEGMTLTLTCDADSNPPSIYVWTLPDDTQKSGNQLQFTSLTTNHTGMYTCMAYTAWGGQNYTANSSINITVVAPSKQPATDANGGNKTSEAGSTGMIIGIVVGGVVLIVLIIIAVVCIKKRKKHEIEEPAEKPRKNQDIVFTGNRPDLVKTDETYRNNKINNMHNITLNNSYDSSDSKGKGDGQMTYGELKFDDKPRSRKPIQLIDTDSTPYGEIAMPRV